MMWKEWDQLIHLDCRGAAVRHSQSPKMVILEIGLVTEWREKQQGF